jgi:L-iditol 2-dehydrogenase
MKVAVLKAAEDIRVEERPIPEVRAGEVLLKVRASGICNSDLQRYAEGKVYHFPIVLGHEFAGEIEDDNGSGTWRNGDRAAVYPLLYCGKCPYCKRGQYNVCTDYNYFGSRTDGAFAEYVAVPEGNLVAIPEDVSLDVASMLEPSSVALNAVRKADGAAARSVVILGAGPIGVVIAQWMRLKGSEKVVLADIDERKLASARELGFDTFINPRQEDFEKAVSSLVGGDGADVCFEATGHSEALNNVIRAARRKGAVVLIGNPVSDMTLAMKVYSSVLRKELAIRSVWNSSFPSDWEETLAALKRGDLDFEHLVSHRYTLEHIKEAFEMMLSGRHFRNKVIIVFGEHNESGRPQSA